MQVEFFVTLLMNYHAVLITFTPFVYCDVLCTRAVARWGLGGLQPPQSLTDQLTLSQPGGADYICPPQYYHPPGFSDLATGLYMINNF